MDCFYSGASFGTFLVSLLRIWLGSGIPLMLSVIGICSALSPLFHSSALVGIHVQLVLQHIISLWPLVGINTVLCMP